MQEGLFSQAVDRGLEEELQCLMTWAIQAVPRRKVSSIWKGSPHEHLKSPSPAGKEFEQVVDLWCLAIGVPWQRRFGGQTGHDNVSPLLGRIEVKGATLKTSGTFLFNQVRDQDYQHVLLLGIGPSRCKMWIETKETAVRLCTWGHASGDDARMMELSTVWVGPSSDGSLACAARILGGPDWELDP